METLDQRVARFNTDYADALDAGRFEAWPTFFAEDGCDYRIVSRENHDAGLPAPLVGCYTHGMVKDRVAMLIKQTLTYQRTYQRRYVTNVRAHRRNDGLISATANLLVMQCDLEGVAAVYMVGRFEDLFVERDGDLRLVRRLVVVDSFSIENVLAVPL